MPGISHPKIHWKPSSAYKLDFENNFFEVIHASLLLIHLTNIDLALREFNRLLKPKGLLYILDVNDETFKGPRILKRLVEKHAEIHIGNRKMLQNLPFMAKNHQLQLECQFATKYINNGPRRRIRFQK